jgi:hypothetical protein
MVAPAVVAEVEVILLPIIVVELVDQELFLSLIQPHKLVGLVSF